MERVGRVVSVEGGQSYLHGVAFLLPHDFVEDPLRRQVIPEVHHLVPGRGKLLFSRGIELDIVYDDEVVRPDLPADRFEHRPFLPQPLERLLHFFVFDLHRDVFDLQPRIGKVADVRPHLDGEGKGKRLVSFDGQGVFKLGKRHRHGRRTNGYR